MSQLILTCSYSSSGSTPEEKWYHAGGNVSASFGVRDRDGRWVTLMEMTIPRPLSSLVPDPNHPAGAILRLDISWDRALNYDFSPHIDQFPRKIADLTTPAWPGQATPTRAEIEHQRWTQLAGWTRLVAIHFATGQRKAVPGLERQAAFWEEFLFEEMCDFPWLRARSQGARRVLASPDDARHFRSWQKTATCTVETLWSAPESRATFVAARIAPNRFPCLAVGLAEARRYIGGI